MQPVVPNDKGLTDILLLSDVIASTYRAFPLLESARLQAGVAGGQQTSAMGAYDVKLDYYSLNQPVGFYETYRSGLGLARQLWWGGYASAGYRVGRGNFEPWYKERETNGSGEFRVALVQPLLQGRAIDPYRVEWFQANLRRQAVQPEIQQQILAASLDASRAFWNWVELGNVLKAQEQLLKIAVERGEQLDRNFQAQSATRLEIVFNNQQVQERRLKILETRQKFQESAFKLALFLRDENGNPLVAAPDWAPVGFPKVERLPEGNFEADFADATSRRPELALIQVEIQQLRWDLQLARNQTLPNLDLTMQSVQNIGKPTSSLNDKGDYQLEAGLVGGVPIQRRKATGKIVSTEAKLQQVAKKREYQWNKIEVELRSARNALDLAYQSIIQARELLTQAEDALDISRRVFKAGNADFFVLLAQEVKVNDSKIKLLESERDFFVALASMQAALGLDPLEQSLLLSPDQP